VGKIIKFILALVKYVLMPFRLWFLEKASDDQDVSSSKATAKDKS
jgi:hypothetical protein